MDIQLDVNEAKISASSSNKVTANLEGVNKNDLIDLISIKDFVAFYNISDILSEIDVEDVKKYFDLTENEE